jgi:hypothetical protein
MDAMLQKVAEKIENLLYPELRPYGRGDRARLLRKASETPLDFVEWAGILVGLVVVVSVTRYGVPGFGLVDRIAVALVNFLVAIPLLAVTVGPFLLRRQRRGLRAQLH